ncbi:F-box domain-containing protein [Heracleum sosnowskyi]|uniref:F-box domain-containing protein n=1 Tax=Heracleum sosnowskyi TaxID=360622 RepID=A0AAD8HZ23_9APIA|nr:F-box domain-containing protein [Heracleum sosnowskyi]
MASDDKTWRLDYGDAVDRISNLPANLMGLILKSLPLQDAARTSVLSKKWRGIWRMLPCLVFDDKFFGKLLSKRILKKDKESQLSGVSRTISGILLAHSGPILKFHLCIPLDLPLHKYPDTIFWIRNISHNGVRKLKLYNKAISPYEIPSYFFSCSELTHLRLKNCILNPPLKFGGFCNLISVRLVDVIITTAMSFGTQLGELYLNRCTGIEHLGCQFEYNNNLTVLSIMECGEVELQWFDCTQKVENLRLVFNGVAKKIMGLDKLVNKMPKIHTLYLNGFLLKSLQPGATVMKRPTTMEFLKHLHLYDVALCDSPQIQYVICLIRISPNLRNIYMHLNSEVERNGTNLTADMELMVLQYLQSPNLIDVILDDLETVEIHGKVGSADLEFIKFLLASSPSLRWMKLLDDNIFYFEEALKISRELMKFPRASTAAQIIWT